MTNDKTTTHVDGPICDVCGEMATHGARDAYLNLERTDEQGIESWDTGPARFGCDDHRVAESREFRPSSPEWKEFDWQRARSRD